MFEKVLKNKLLIQAVEKLSTGGSSLKLSGLWGSSAPLIAAALGKLSGKTVIFVTAHLDDVDDVAEDVEVFSGTSVEVFGAWEASPTSEHVSDEVIAERMRLCNLLAQPANSRQQPADVIVTSMMALIQPVPSPEALGATRKTLSRGLQLPPEELLGWLVDSGFDSVDQVDQAGEFAHRGGIIDVFPAGAAQAVRIEFFGDFIDSIRYVDLDTQRSTQQIDSFDFISLVAGRAQSADDSTSLVDYLPKDAIVCMTEPEDLRTLAGQLHERMRETQGDSDAFLISPDDIFVGFGRLARVEMYPFSAKGPSEAFDIGIRSLQRLSTNTDEALSELCELSAVADVWVYCENSAEKDRFKQLLTGKYKKLADRVNTGIGHVQGGFYWPDERLVVVGHHEIFHRYSKIRRLKRIRMGRPIESLLDLNNGDYVVHVAHGIAKFDGLRELKRDGRSEEYLTLRFADNAVLHVPASQINLVQKYIGARQKRPNLSKLGGGSWAKQKQRVTEAVRDMAAGMIQMQAMRQSMEGIIYPQQSDWQRQFAEEFIYTETEDQLAAIEDIDRDMAAARPMDRLLCGDVGYGKTELAMRAAFKVAEAGKQVAVLVPTTVLADQHYRTFSERFADYPFEVDVISRFRKPSEQKQIVERLAAGQIDILIGTHRLLSDDIRFADIGLVVIDEEQRFGVEHKEGLKKLRATVDVMTMTATPIPRTLHMAMLGLRDISALATPPMDRRAICTEVCHRQDELVRQAVVRELNRQGQLFFVHNRVYNIRPLADQIQALVPEARVSIAHGQMSGTELEETMLRFLRCEIDVLVCTTIIESGLDIPTANTIIIHNADRFGLAELHQLRGRVGRYKHRAYCYLLLPDNRPVSRVASKRLKTIEEFSDLGAGFQIAMRDLEIRGAGNILGREQSGHIAVVGYELYCQLLEQAVGELQGKKLPKRPEVHIELGVDVYIPRSYIPSERQRMEVYRRLANCSSQTQLRQISDDLKDAYGEIPDAAGVVLDLAEIRILSGELGLTSIIIMQPDVVFSVRDFKMAEVLFKGAAGSVRLPDEKTVHWRPPASYLEMPTLINVLLKRLRHSVSDV